MSGYRKPYTKEEEEAILKFIVEKEGYTSLRGCHFWETMEAAKVTERTWQSMKEHFRKFMVANLNSTYYRHIHPAELNRIRRGYGTSSTRKAKDTPESSWMDKPMSGDGSDSEDDN